MKMFRPSSEQVAHLVRAAVSGGILLGLAGMVFFVFTTQVFAVALWSGIWYFALVLLLTFLFFFVVALRSGFHSHNRLERFLFCAVGLGLIAGSTALGIVFRPFDPANIKFGALLEQFEPGAVDDLPLARSEVSYLLPPARSQGSCGGCWAFAVALVVSTRASLSAPVATSRNSCTGELQGTFLVSPQALVDADSIDPATNAGKCNAQYVSTGFALAGGDNRGGVVDDNASPVFVQLEPDCASCPAAPITKYTALDGKVRNGCFRVNGFRPANGVPRAVVASSAYSIRGEEAIMKEISARGPVVATVNFYRKKNGNFPAWCLQSSGGGSLFVSPNYVVRPADDGAEYTKTFNSRDGAHAFVIYGYGTREDGLKFWEVRNSWGPSWGSGGSIKIERGVDAWNIESYVSAALVKKV
jgi:hypothetical protein